MKMSKKSRDNWSSFFILIGFMFSAFMVGALVIGSSAGETSWGYVISHSILAWIVVGVLLFITIWRCVVELKKEKEFKKLAGEKLTK